MRQQYYARRKSRIIIHRADRWVPVVRAAGRVIIVGPKWKRPIILRGGYTITGLAGKRKDNLRSYLIRFHEGPVGSYWNVFLLLASFGFGAAVMRNFYEFVVLR